MDQEELKKYYDYNPETGDFIRKDRANGKGSIDSYGYLIFKIKGKQYKSHRLAWLFFYGFLPSGVIDHINGVKTDNRILNLRDVMQKDNCRNASIKINKATGCKGIYFDNTKGLNKNYATKIEGKTYRFYTIEEAFNFRYHKLKELGYGERHF